jgi:hypothetical protein
LPEVFLTQVCTLAGISDALTQRLCVDVSHSAIIAHRG